jgi:hypothetical protein
MPFSPYDAATHALKRARALLNAAQPQGGIASANLRTDMRRLGVVMAVSALDTYMHRLVIERAFWHEDLPSELAKLDVRFDSLLRQADDTTVAARMEPHGARPRVGVKRQLRDRLLRDSFQSFDAVGKALSMTGKTGLWKEIGAEFDPAMTPVEIKRKLNSVVARRNQIVHEGDYERLERPRGARRNPMPPADARAHLKFMEELIGAIHIVVSR